ncbi:hypothetical protein PDESU_00861 [Pontiella desulfatans]|uniref:Uncharacterized protein n=1 Tax=Pontiella desulfatans TaxID=2750659 RepID=A0A6C2TXF4_PONDE|nr:hypothetical protein [Pontiella desulfatans]VGO12310.1 hypothetical protein PDESU_00861 [Pontiella desulfatans]
MFLEVYAVNLENYTNDTADSKKPENRRLIEMTGVRIRTSEQFDDRAELVMPNGEILLAAGSYDDLVGRLMTAAKSTKIARI